VPVISGQTRPSSAAASSHSLPPVHHQGDAQWQQQVVCRLKRAHTGHFQHYRAG
jgi:hypothetical protein